MESPTACRQSYRSCHVQETLPCRMLSRRRPPQRAAYLGDQPHARSRHRGTRESRHRCTKGRLRLRSRSLELQPRAPGLRGRHTRESRRCCMKGRPRSRPSKLVGQGHRDAATARTASRRKARPSHHRGNSERPAATIRSLGLARPHLPATSRRGMRRGGRAKERLGHLTPVN